MVLEFIKSEDGTRYLMPRKGLKNTVLRNDPKLETLAFQTLSGATDAEGMSYLAVYHHRCLRVFSVRDALVNQPLRDAMEHKVLPFVCADTIKKRAGGDRGLSVAVLFGGKVYSVPCSETGRFPKAEEIQSFITQQPTAICTLEVE